jgi:hypothetical protein
VGSGDINRKSFFRPTYPIRGLASTAGLRITF